MEEVAVVDPNIGRLLFALYTNGGVFWWTRHVAVRAACPFGFHEPGSWFSQAHVYLQKK